MSAGEFGFARPEALGALLTLPLLAASVIALRALRRRRLERFARSAAVEPRLRTELLGPLLVAGLLALAMAGPSAGVRLVEVPVRSIDVLVLLDLSRSMGVADEDPDRLSRARRELLDLSRRFRGGRLGLMTFGGDATLVCPFTRDREAFAEFVRGADPLFQRHGGTDLGRALLTAAEAFDESEARRVVLVVSDAENLGDEERVRDAAWRLYGAGVVVHALVVGTEEGGPVPAHGGAGFVVDASGARVRSSARPEALRPVVERTGGRLVRAGDAPFPLARLVDEELSDVVELAGGTTLRQMPIDRYRFLLPPVLLLLLWPFLPRGRRRRPVRAAFALAAAAPALLAFADAEAEARAAAARGNERYAAGEYDVALRRFDEALESSPEHPGVLFNRAATLYRLGRPAEAARGFDGARARASSGALHAAAAFGAGVARARQAEQDLVRAGDDPRRLAAVAALLREARFDLVQALAGGAGRDAAVDLELVSLLLEELTRREESREGSSGGAGDASEATDAPGDDAEETDANAPDESRDGKAAAPRGARGEEGSPKDDDAASAGSVDGEPSAEPRLPGGLFREEASSIEEIVRRYERERFELDRRRARESRERTERDW